MARIHTRLKNDTVNKQTKKRWKPFLKELGFDKLIPKLMKISSFWFYLDRTYAFYDFYPEDLNIPPHSVKEVEKQFHSLNGYITYQLHESEKEITPADGFGKYQSLLRTVESIFTDDSKLRRQFTPYIDEQRHPKNSESLCFRMIEAAAMAIIASSSIDGYIYGLLPESGWIKDDLGWDVLNHRFGVFRTEAKRKKITVNGKKRFCYELVMNEALKTFSSQTLTWEKKEYALYVQAHALKRIVERLCMDNQSDSYNILRVHTLYEKTFIYEDKILIPVAYNPEVGDTVGYLVCALTEKECVIQTFLFITQVGTPEGDMLSEQLSLDKEGQNYLELVNYDQLVKSDIREDEYLRTIFRKCNLDHLFAIDDNKTGRLLESASFIRKILMLDEVEMGA